MAGMILDTLCTVKPFFLPLSFPSFHPANDVRPDLSQRVLLGCLPGDIFHVASLLYQGHELLRPAAASGCSVSPRARPVKEQFNMRKATMGCAAALALAGLLWAASDPWKAKPYSQWDANEVRKVLNDSPWAKLVTVPASWRPDSGSNGSVGALNPTGGPRRRRGGGGRGGGG